MLPLDEMDEQIGKHARKLALHKGGFFVRQKSNGEWEAGYGQAAGENSVRADYLLPALQALAYREKILV